MKLIEEEAKQIRERISYLLDIPNDYKLNYIENLIKKSLARAALDGVYDSEVFKEAEEILNDNKRSVT